MRSTLLTIPLNYRIDLGSWGTLPVFGFGLLLAVWSVIGLTYVLVHCRRYGTKGLGVTTVLVWLGPALAIFIAPEQFKELPIYGYGTMLFLGFVASAWLAAWRIRREGADGEIAWDATMWLFVSGIVGGRLFYVVQYWPKFFG